MATARDNTRRTAGGAQLPVSTDAFGEYSRIVTPSGPRGAGSQLAS